VRWPWGSDQAQVVIERYASAGAAHFRPSWPESSEYHFDLGEAKKLLAKKDDEAPLED
jgi:hypothetical protein